MAISDLDAEISLVDGYVEKLKSSEQQEIPKIQETSQEIKQLAKNAEQIQQSCREVEALEEERAIYRKLFDDLSRSHKELQEATEGVEELQGPLQYTESKQKRLFEKCMGLEFKLTDDKAISFVFRHVNKSDPQQAFTVTLDMDSEGAWNAISMEPVVHGVKPLLDQLNETNNLTQFCKHFRQKIKETINNC